MTRSDFIEIVLNFQVNSHSGQTHTYSVLPNVLTAWIASPLSPMVPPPLLLQHVHISRADFLYKTGDEARWTRLPSPVGDKRHNCYGIKFDGGMILTQKDHKHGSVCHVKLILNSFDMLYENGRPIIEAECVEIRNPRFTARPDYGKPSSMQKVCLSDRSTRLSPP